jgi:uncharacterized membrane protein
MNTNCLRKSEDAENLAHKWRFAAVSMPLLGLVGGTLRMFDVPSRVSLSIIVPVFVVLFVLAIFWRSGRQSRHEHVRHDHLPKPRQPRPRPAI